MRDIELIFIKLKWNCEFAQPVFRTAIKEQGMLVDILKLLKSSDIEMMNNAATVTFNVSVYWFSKS